MLVGGEVISICIVGVFFFFPLIAASPFPTCRLGCLSSMLAQDPNLGGETVIDRLLRIHPRMPHNPIEAMNRTWTQVGD